MLQLLQILQLLGMVLTADLRERDAELSQYAVNSANAEVVFCADCALSDVKVRGRYP